MKPSVFDREILFGVIYVKFDVIFVVSCVENLFPYPQKYQNDCTAIPYDQTMYVVHQCDTGLKELWTSGAVRYRRIIEINYKQIAWTTNSEWSAAHKTSMQLTTLQRYTAHIK